MASTHTESEHEQHHAIKIVVNGRDREVRDRSLTYQQVVKLAFPNDPVEPNTVYTVAYANPHGHDGTLVDCQEVDIKKGMVFNVSKTSRS